MLSKQTKSFFLVLFIGIGTIYTSLLLTREISPVITSSPSLDANTASANQPKVFSETDVNTANWKDYEDPTYPLSFKYPANWSITTYSATDSAIGYIIVLSPPDGSDHIRVYINNEEYVAMDGLKTTKTKIDGTSAVSVHDMLIGVKHRGNFYTFDQGVTPALAPYFKKLIETVSLN